MRTALCLSGQLRTFNLCYPSLKKHILDIYFPDIFIHTWNTQGNVSLKRNNKEDTTTHKENIDVEQLISLLNPKLMTISPYHNNMFDSLNNVSKPKKLYGIYHENKGMIPMFYSIHQCNELKKQYEKKHNKTYDMVIRCRPDLEYLNYIPQHIINSYKKNKETIFIPSWNLKSDISYNDHFAIGSSKNMDIYCDCWNHLQKMWDNYSYKTMCETERVLHSYLNQCQINVKTFLPFYIIHRYNDTIQNIFTKKIVNRFTPRFIRKTYCNVKKDVKQPFTMVEVETSTVCNRRCPYCPVTYYKREKHIMDTDLFRKLVDDLKDIDYDGLFSLMRYNEPLLEERLLDLIKYVKQQLPRCSIKLFTNGDFLNYKLFHSLIDVGVDSLEVTNHWINNSLPVNHLNSFKKMLKHDDKKHIKFKTYPKGSLMNNRGGLLTNLDDMVFNGCGPYENLPLNPQLEVDSYGNVLLCCRQYSKDFGPVFGNIQKYHVMDIWNHPDFIRIRNELQQGVYSLPICKSCRHGFWNGGKNI